jgi:hypothetical protein
MGSRRPELEAERIESSRCLGFGRLEVLRVLTGGA